MPRPIAVLISDVHYSIHTLQLADAAMRQAIAKANELEVPLIVAGDLHDTKANLRGECVNAMIETFRLCHLQPYILRGNHDAINEKSKEHSLNFLQDLAVVIVTPGKYDLELDYYQGLLGYLIPYEHDSEVLKTYLKTLPVNARIIMHQGVIDSNAGHYIQDKSALPKECFEDFRVISGHYHTRQDIKCGRPRKGAVGLFSYIGNPYTLGFGEANDPPKGFQILMSDGTLEFVPTNLRKHLIIKHDLSTKDSEWSSTPGYADGNRMDLIWVKITGPSQQLANFNKLEWCREYGVPTNIRLDLIPDEICTTIVAQTENINRIQVFDNLIDSLTNTEDDRKIRLKSMWKDFVE